MCNNFLGGCGGNSCFIILIIIVLLCCCGGGNNYANNGGCGCNDCGCRERLRLLINKHYSQVMLPKF